MKTADEERARLLEKRAKLDARLRELKQREKKQRRARETRGKIIAGANALELVRRQPGFRVELAALMNRTVKRPEDRALFDFLDPAPAAAEGFAEAAGNPAPDEKPKDD